MGAIALQFSSQLTRGVVLSVVFPVAVQRQAQKGQFQIGWGRLSLWLERSPSPLALQTWMRC